MISAVMMLMACGGQSKKETSDADSTQVFEVPDTLNTASATSKQDLPRAHQQTEERRYL